MLNNVDTRGTSGPSKVRQLLAPALKHPVALRLRGLLRRAWWTWRARGASNPPLPAEVRSILFVCLGNICRSPFGAERSRLLLAERGRSDIRCTSAGIRPSQDNRSPDFACEASTAYGVDLSEHRPRLLTSDLMESHDLVVVMEWRQLQLLRETYPAFWDRIFLLSLFDSGARTAYERYNITDPFGRPLDAFEECYRRMDGALRACLACVQGSGSAEPER